MTIDRLHALFGGLATLEQGDKLVDRCVHLRAVFGGTGDDQRRTGLVDQNGVNFIDHREIGLALELVFQTEGHVVAQVVKAQLVVGAVSNIALVGSALLLWVLEWHHHTNGHAKELVQRTHGIGVTAGQIVVDRHHVNALAGQRIQVDRQRCYQRLTLTGFHLGDLAFVQCHAADQLDIKVTHAHHPLARLADNGKGFGQQLVQGGTIGQALLELAGLRLQLFIAQRIQPLFLSVDGNNHLAHALQLTIVLASQQLSD